VDTDSINHSIALTDKIDKGLHVAGVPFSPSKFVVGAKSSIQANVVPFLAFALISWLGLGIVWYQYTRVIQPTAEEQIFNRVWSLVGIVLLGWVVAWLINVWTPGDVEPSEPSKKRPRRRRHGGVMWERTKSHASDNEDNGDEDVDDSASRNDVELRPLSATFPDAGFTRGATDLENHLSESKCNVTLEEVEGRPSVHELMSALDGAQCPGLFICGPTSLTEAIRHASQERCLIRMRHCIRGTPHISLYEEAFEM
jgi:hypothetical protein